jgi:hypothetical protein
MKEAEKYSETPICACQTTQIPTSQDHNLQSYLGGTFNFAQS